MGQAAQARGVAPAQIALAWLRHQPSVVAPLVGAGSTAQIDEAVLRRRMAGRTVRLRGTT